MFLGWPPSFVLFARGSGPDLVQDTAWNSMRAQCCRPRAKPTHYPMGFQFLINNRFPIQVVSWCNG